MRVINAGFSILQRDGQRGNIAIIEQAARTCYKSEAKIKADGSSAEAIVSSLIRNQHEAMLEHGDYIFEVTPDAYEMTARRCRGSATAGFRPPCWK